MKKFALFSGEDYYPNGGWDDFRGSFDSVEEATTSDEVIKSGWWHVVDLSTGDEVEAGWRKNGKEVT